MNVKIYKCSEKSYWYKDDIGKEFEIEVDLKGYPCIYGDEYYEIKNDEYRLILIDDCYAVQS